MAPDGSFCVLAIGRSHQRKGEETWAPDPQASAVKSPHGFATLVPPLLEGADRGPMSGMRQGNVDRASAGTCCAVERSPLQERGALGPADLSVLHAKSHDE